MKKGIFIALLTVVFGSTVAAQSTKPGASKKTVKKSTERRSPAAKTITLKDSAQYPAKLPLLPPVTDTSLYQRQEP